MAVDATAHHLLAMSLSRASLAARRLAALQRCVGGRVFGCAAMYMPLGTGMAGKQSTGAVQSTHHQHTSHLTAAPLRRMATTTWASHAVEQVDQSDVLPERTLKGRTLVCMHEPAVNGLNWKINLLPCPPLASSLSLAPAAALAWPLPCARPRTAPTLLWLRKPPTRTRSWRAPFSQQQRVGSTAYGGNSALRL